MVQFAETFGAATEVTVIVAEPADLALTIPPATVATASLLDDQRTLVKVVLEGVNATVSFLLLPSVIFTELLEIVIAVGFTSIGSSIGSSGLSTGAFSLTVKETVADLEPAVAVIVALPAATK